MIVAILLIGHLLADFYLQSSKMAEKKQEKFRFLLSHSVIYLLVISVLCLTFITSSKAMVSTLIIGVTHFIIDWIRTKIDSKTTDSAVRFMSFLVDQILHVGIILMTYYLLNLETNVNSLYHKCAMFSEFKHMVLYGLLFIILINPAAVLVKKLFAFLFEQTEEEGNSNHNAGSIIGKLERIITSILLICNQYGVIGLVLTAKSIARFKQLEERDFAEKYLVGTLTSLVISLITTILIKMIVNN